MCFLKQVKTTKNPQAALVSPTKVLSQDISSQIATSTDLSSFPKKKGLFTNKPDCLFLLTNCLGLINLNSQMMVAIGQKLDQAEQALQYSGEALSQETEFSEEAGKRSAPFLRNVLQKEEQNQIPSNDPLTAKLFGKGCYRYRLALDGDFPTTLYKERNFSCQIRLIEIESGKEWNNGNIINICLGICDDFGEWILETKDGQAFVKGKIETELYHGNAGFAKLAPRDVSRSYVNKTVNVVVYPKPSVLRYSGESSIEEHVDFSLIEPLVIHGVSVKAKKRE